MRRRSSFLVPWHLAWADLSHEWIMSLCMILALSAVVSPLLLVMGLKHGTVDTLRSRLLDDPRNREIRPKTAVSYDSAWFEKINSLPETGFIIPSTRMLSASVTLKAKKSGRTVSADLWPTREGDPLLVDNKSVVPDRGEATLSESGAEALDVVSGSEIEVVVSRTGAAGLNEVARATLRVVSVAPQRAAQISVAFVPLNFLDAVERYKDGGAVAELGWPGSTPKVKPVFDGVWIAGDEKIDELEKSRLINQTGWSVLDESPKEKPMPDHGRQHIYLLKCEQSPSGEDSFIAVADVLRGRGFTLYPFIRPIEARQDGKSVKVFPRVLTPYSEDFFKKQFDRTLMLKSGQTKEVVLSVGSGDCSVYIPFVTGIDSGQSNAVEADVFVMGVLRQAALRPTKWEPVGKNLLLVRMGYAGFRLYAKKLEDVAVLQKTFESQEIGVITQSERIRDVVEMDKKLTFISMLVGGVGGIGAIAALAASLAGAVERKRRYVGVLQLLGVSSGQVLQFLLCQSISLVAAALILSSAVFWGGACFIDMVFAKSLADGESFCRISQEMWCITAIVSIGLALLASLFAGFKAMRIEPSDAIRDE